MTIHACAMYSVTIGFILKQNEVITMAYFRLAQETRVKPQVAYQQLVVLYILI